MSAKSAPGLYTSPPLLALAEPLFHKTANFGGRADISETNQRIAAAGDCER